MIKRSRACLPDQAGLCDYTIMRSSVKLKAGAAILSQGDYITRGWNSGEIILFSYWYWEDDYYDYQAVLRSNDYGESLEINFC